MEIFESITKVVENTASYSLLISLVLVSIYFLVKYIKKMQEQTRLDIKDVHKSYRNDIIELMNRCKEERDEQRATLEKMSSDSNEVMKELTIAVAELKLIVDIKLR